MHPYNRDLYGQQLKVCICGYLRPEQNFDSLQSLIAAIQKDIKEAEERLDQPQYLKLRNSQFFRSAIGNGNAL